ncbi:unnamed protein product [Hymenolepis diminuta]|uniref:Uncharacterized protein n=1 Tax=Hymenolepis diminuta TaxID=6216 RepID=A0A0R3SQX4_HYMDI|nr:unnamed protein product [Hymenolepis diminuta]
MSRSLIVDFNLVQETSSDNYPTNIRSCHFQDADFSETAIFEDVAAGTAMKMGTIKASAGLMEINVSSRKYVNLTIDGCQFELQVDTDSDITIVPSQHLMLLVMQCNSMDRCQEKTISKSCYVVDRNINLFDR